MSTAETNSKPSARASPMFTPFKKVDLVWLLAPNGVLPCASPSSVRYSRPIELVDHLPMWKWFSSSASQRWTLKREGNSHDPNGANGHCSAASGRSTKVVLF